MHPVCEALQKAFPEVVLGVSETYQTPTIEVQRDGLLPVAKFLKERGDMEFDHITDICSVDYPEDDERFEVVYFLHSLPHRQRVVIKTKVLEHDPTIESVTSIWEGANFLEREVYDLMGIRFQNHPDLRRILLPEDFPEGHPLRKDFPTEGKGWRAQFDFFPDLDEQPRSEIDRDAAEHERQVFARSSGKNLHQQGEVSGPPREEEFLLNMGPQHPATHGVLRVVLALNGERIVKATVDPGYLHRGVEKLAEGLTYGQIIPHTDRLDYVCAMTNNYAYVRTVETLLNLEVPERSEYIRTIVAEMQRIIGHLFWLGTQALDIGAMTVFFWTFREREELLDMFEALCGARLTLNYFRVGGVDSDFDSDLVARVLRFIDAFPGHIDEYDILLAKNRIWLSRTKDVAVISAEDAINFGLTGPVIRGSGVAYDVRKFSPYGAYGEVEWAVPVGKYGDTYDRYWVRMEEMRQCCRIIRQCLEKLPDGPIMADAPGIVPPPKEQVMRDMQSHIHHFILFTHGFHPPAGAVYCPTESPKGELGFYIVSDGSARPYRMKIRSPSFVHLGALDHMSRGYLVSDLVTMFGSYDVVMGECDR